MRPVRTLLLPAVLAAASLAVPAAASAAPLTANFTMDPAAPQPGQVVTFTNTSTGGPGTITPHWDLDNDGEYDNGTAQTVTRTFPARQHTVRLLVTSVGPTTETDSVAKTFTVAAAPQPTATPTPTPTATPTPPPPPSGGNQAPEAPLDLACGALRRGVQLCLGEYARIGAPKTFDASGAVDGFANLPVRRLAAAGVLADILLDRRGVNAAGAALELAGPLDGGPVSVQRMFRDLAAGNVALARSAPAHAAARTRAVGERLTAGGEARLATLATAIDTAGDGSPLARVRAQLALRSTLRRTGRRSDARTPLSQARREVTPRAAGGAQGSGDVTAHASRALRARLGATRGGSSGILG